ncbi:MAG: hypothetical protein KF760_28960 [Candidatus Eremiobacteraeota bacterium]|nr:hypothetical protein [Candidatus Eremiobacteraeota bacterium]MCW5865996.1 hypothetical protein [Candidatus Eremiobacteraeota bacterium]
MRLSVWQLSTVILLSVLLGQNLKTRPQVAEAASQDVFGSPQVAISSYKNQKGSFILWADGHISNVDTPNTVVSQLSECVDAPEVPAVTRDTSKPQGSPNVPVGVYQNATATYVLFADGSYKKPKGDAAAASAAPSVRSGHVNGFAFTVDGDTSLSVAPMGTVGNYRVTFNPPFKELPTVTVSSESYPGLAGVLPGSLSKNGCSVFTCVVANGGGVHQDNSNFAITAVGE